MTSPVTSAVLDANAKALEILAKVQAPIVDAVRTVTATVDTRVPAVRRTISGIEALPSADEVVDTGFAVAQKLLDNQRSFAKSLAQAAAAPKAKATTAKSTTTKTTTARRAKAAA